MTPVGRRLVVFLAAIGIPLTAATIYVWAQPKATSTRWYGPSTTAQLDGSSVLTPVAYSESRTQPQPKPAPSTREGADSPEAAVRQLLDGLAASNQDAILDITDPAHRDEPLGFGNAALVGQALVSLLTGVDIGRPSVSFRDLSYRTQYEQDQNYATVYVSGRVRSLGQEKVISDDNALTLKKASRWYVTTGNDPYWKAKSDRLKEQAAASATAAAEAKRRADIDRITSNVSISIATPVWKPDTTTAGWGHYHTNITFRNRDAAEHDVSWRAFGMYSGPVGYVCPPAIDPRFMSIRDRKVPPGGELTVDANNFDTEWLVGTCQWF